MNTPEYLGLSDYDKFIKLFDELKIKYKIVDDMTSTKIIKIVDDPIVAFTGKFYLVFNKNNELIDTAIFGGGLNGYYDIKQND